MKILLRKSDMRGALYQRYTAGDASKMHHKLCVSDDTIMKTSKGEKQWELRHITHIHLPEEI